MTQMKSFQLYSLFSITIVHRLNLIMSNGGKHNVWLLIFIRVWRKAKKKLDFDLSSFSFFDQTESKRKQIHREIELLVFWSE